MDDKDFEKRYGNKLGEAGKVSGAINITTVPKVETKATVEAVNTPTNKTGTTNNKKPGSKQ